MVEYFLALAFVTWRHRSRRQSSRSCLVLGTEEECGRASDHLLDACALVSLEKSKHTVADWSGVNGAIAGGRTCRRPAGDIRPLCGVLGQSSGSRHGVRGHGNPRLRHLVKCNALHGVPRSQATGRLRTVTPTCIPVSDRRQGQGARRPPTVVHPSQPGGDGSSSGFPSPGFG